MLSRIWIFFPCTLLVQNMTIHCTDFSVSGGVLTFFFFLPVLVKNPYYSSNSSKTWLLHRQVKQLLEAFISEWCYRIATEADFLWVYCSGGENCLIFACLLNLLCGAERCLLFIPDFIVQLTRPNNFPEVADLR